MHEQPCVYMVANRRKVTIYTGIRSDPVRRIFEHREGLVAGFSRKYSCKLLVWYEVYDDMSSAIAREKQIKAGSRQDKIVLIETMNPTWADLYETIV